MNSKQLGIFLQNIERRLSKALEYADRQMPPDTERFEEKHYVGSSPFPVLDLKNWESRKTGAPVAFSELLDLADELRTQSEALINDVETPNAKLSRRGAENEV